MGFRDDLENAVRGAACSYFNNANNLQGWIAGVVPVPGAGLIANNFTRPALNGAIALFCDVPPDPLPPAPFTGGQCVGTVYALEVDVLRNGVNVTFSDNRLGPIGIPQYIQDGGSWRGRWFRPDGTTSLWSFDSISTGFPQPTILDARIVSVVSGPDDCGDLIAQYPPPTTVPPIEDRTFPIPIGPLNLQVAIGLGNIQVNGDLTANIRVTGPEIDLSGQINFNNNKLNFTVGGGDPENNNCKDQPPAAENPPPETDPPDEPDDPSKQIVGVLVTVDSFSNTVGTTTIMQGDNPNILAPAIGYVNFRLKLGSAFGWSVDYPVKNTRCFIPAPSGFFATSVAGTPRSGVTWTLTPVKGTAETIVID